MKRFAIFISLHLFLFLLVIAYQAQSSEWTIDRYKTLSFARVSGEVTHGDNLNFWIRAEDDCAKVYNTFTVYTYEKPGDFKQLLNKNIPIKLNGADITASVQDIAPFLMGYRVHLSLGSYPIKEYVHFLKVLPESHNTKPSDSMWQRPINWPAPTRRPKKFMMQI